MTKLGIRFMCDSVIKNDFFTKNRVKTALRVGLAIYFFVNKKEAYCTEIDGGRDITISKAEDGSAIGFEILNYLPKDTKIGLNRIPVESKIIHALS